MKALKPSPGFRGRRGIMMVAGVILLGITCVTLLFFAVPALSGGPEDLGFPALPILLVFEVPFVAVGIGLIVWGALPLIARLRMTTPQVAISNDTLRVGEAFWLTYQQEFKRAVDVNRVQVRFVLRETATYRRGTTTTTVTHDHEVEQFELPSRRYEAGETLAGRRELRIPPDGMHTFRAARNQIEWLIVLHVGITGWPDFQEEFPVTVLAERVMGNQSLLASSDQELANSDMR